MRFLRFHAELHPLFLHSNIFDQTIIRDRDTLGISFDHECIFYPSERTVFMNDAVLERQNIDPESILSVRFVTFFYLLRR